MVGLKLILHITRQEELELILSSDDRSIELQLSAVRRFSSRISFVALLILPFDKVRWLPQDRDRVIVILSSRRISMTLDENWWTPHLKKILTDRPATCNEWEKRSVRVNDLLYFFFPIKQKFLLNLYDVCEKVQCAASLWLTSLSTCSATTTRSVNLGLSGDDCLEDQSIELVLKKVEGGIEDGWRWYWVSWRWYWRRWRWYWRSWRWYWRGWRWFWRRLKMVLKKAEDGIEEDLKRSGNGIKFLIGMILF